MTGVAASLFREMPDPDDRWQRLNHLVGLPFSGIRVDNSDFWFWIAVAASCAAWACLFFVVMPGLAAVLGRTKDLLTDRSIRGRVVRRIGTVILLGGIVLAGRRGLRLIATNGSDNPYSDSTRRRQFGYVTSGVIAVCNATGKDLSVKLALDGRPHGEVSVPGSRDPHVVDNRGLCAEIGLNYDLRTRQLEVEETRPEKRRFTFSLWRFSESGEFLIRVSTGKANLRYDPLPS